jgi:PadR family transcriptional regulator PadR
LFDNIITYKGERMIFQLGAGLLDACVLSVLSKEDAYGYMLTQALKESLDISESTLYPVLRRLQKDGYLTTYDKLLGGRNRRYYSITKKGADSTEFYRNEWKEFKVNIDGFLGDVKVNGKADGGANDAAK